MIFLFPRWDMLVPWRVPQFFCFVVVAPIPPISRCSSICSTFNRDFCNHWPGNGCLLSTSFGGENCMVTSNQLSRNSNPTTSLNMFVLGTISWSLGLAWTQPNSRVSRWVPNCPTTKTSAMFCASHKTWKKKGKWVYHGWQKKSSKTCFEVT